jgi:transcriptional regulator with GAF, ATPase, and Fis domain
MTLKKQNVKIQNLEDISLILHKGLNVKETYETIFTHIQNLIPFETATLFLYNENQNKLEVTFKHGERHVDLASDSLFSRAKGVSGFVSNQRLPVILQSLANSRIGKQDKFKSFLSLPLWIGDKLVGVLNLGHSKSNVYQYDLLSEYEILARQISIVVDKMNLQKEVEKLNKQLSETLNQLKNAQDQLVKKEQLAAIGEIVVTVNREINNPLSTIFTNAEMLQHLLQNKNDEALERISDRIMSAATKISEVTKKISNLTNTLSKTHSDNVPLQILTD